MKTDTVPFGYIYYDNGSFECEESSLCTWLDPSHRIPVPYCHLHGTECPHGSSQLLGCYTEPTCGGRVVPPDPFHPVPPRPPIIIIPGEETVPEPPPPKPNHRKLFLALLLSIIGIFLLIIFVILLRQIYAVRGGAIKK
jgi:hypothetical protein